MRVACSIIVSGLIPIKTAGKTPNADNAENRPPMEGSAKMIFRNPISLALRSNWVPGSVMAMKWDPA